MKYRKKAVVIEAIQLRWNTWNDVCDFLGEEFFKNGGEGIQVVYSWGGDDNEPFIGLKIPTLEGVMTASQNDYIIRGIKGEIYPCKPDIFNATYEKVVEVSGRRTGRTTRAADEAIQILFNYGVVHIVDHHHDSGAKSHKRLLNIVVDRLIREHGVIVGRDIQVDRDSLSIELL